MILEHKNDERQDQVELTALVTPSLTVSCPSSLPWWRSVFPRSWSLLTFFAVPLGSAFRPYSRQQSGMFPSYFPRWTLNTNYIPKFSSSFNTSILFWTRPWSFLMFSLNILIKFIEIALFLTPTRWDKTQQNQVSGKKILCIMQRSAWTTRVLAEKFWNSIHFWVDWNSTPGRLCLDRQHWHSVQTLWVSGVNTVQTSSTFKTKS